MGSVANPGRGARKPDGNADAAIDVGLVRRFRAGDEAAFNQIIERHYGRIRALAFQVLRNQGDAEEVAQDTFVRAHRSLAAFRGDCPLAVWLYRIGLNLARNRYWFHHRRHRHTTVSLDRPADQGGNVPLAEALFGELADPRTVSITGEFVANVADCMERLAPSHREILRMRTMLNLSNEEIAAQLKINVGAVRGRVARAREHLRSLLQESAP